MRVAIVAEYYPRTRDPVLGVWAHRQALAARDAGADVRVLVLHRLVPPRSALRARDLGALLAPFSQPPLTRLDGLDVAYVPYLSPPRWRSYERWGAWAAPPLALALRALRRRFPYELVHAHYAIPAGDAVRRAQPGTSLVVSVHGGDVLGTAARGEQARAAVARALGHARLVLANSQGTARRCEELSPAPTRVVHLGTDVPPERESAPRSPLLVTVGHLVARKRHADVIRALALLADRHPALCYRIVGEGPERAPLAALARELGVGERVELPGALAPAAARAAAQAATLFVLPSVEEAFGVAYVEAMAGGVVAIGCRGEDGPEEIAALSGEGIVLVPPRDPRALAEAISALLEDPARLAVLGAAARAGATLHFTWERCGAATVSAYAEALRL